jgi:nucleoside-diphosphate-sugar epimerase
LNQNIYATGLSGTIGKHLKELVIPLNIRLENLDESTKIEPLTPSSVVIHLAGIVGYRSIDKNEKYSRLINVESTKTLAKKALAAGISKFVFISTAHVYKSSMSPLTENSVIDPINKYAEQKFEAEEALRDIFKFTNEKLCIVRVFGVLDWDMKPDTLGGAVKSLVYSNFSEIINHGLDVRDFSTPRQIAKTVLEIAKAPGMYGIVNLCSGHGLTVEQAVVKMLDKSKLMFNSTIVKRNNSTTPVILGDNSKLITYFPNLKMSWSPSDFKLENKN